MLLEVSAAASTGLFAGAAVYVNLVEQPARLALGPAAAVAEFAPSYRRATVMQAPLAAVGFLSGLASWLGHGGAAWLIAALLIGGVIPFTVVVILPTNERLLAAAAAGRAGAAPDGAPADTEIAALLVRWGRLHAVRSLASTAAFVIYLLLLRAG